MPETAQKMPVFPTNKAFSLILFSFLYEGLKKISKGEETMASIKKSIETTETKDEYGRVTESESIIRTVSIGRSGEPEYVKIYTNNFKLIKDLKNESLKIFLILCQHVGYADVSDKAGGQLVKIDKDIKEKIMNELDISLSTLSRGLADLKNHKLIKKIDGAIYQMNPFLVGRGFWEYRPSYRSGGVGDLRNDWNVENRRPPVATCQVSDDSEIIKYHLKEEIKKNYGLFWAAVRERKGLDADYYQSLVDKYTKELKEMDAEEYSKYVRYAVEVNNEDIDPLFDEEEEETLCSV